MWRATWKGLLGHKLRLALTALAIVLGTGFVSGSYVFTDTLGQIFDDLFAGAFAGTDVIVQSVADEDLSFALRDRLEPTLVGEIAGLEGVAAAEGTVVGFLSLANQEGELLGGQGPPTIGAAWVETGNAFELRAGQPPAADGELVIDAASAERFGLEVGDRVQLIALGRPEDFSVVGLIGLGSSDGFGGATAVGLEKATADRIFGAGGKLDAINVVADEEVTPETLIDRIGPILPKGVEVIDARLAAEQQLEGFKQALGFINTFLLVFGAVSLFVGSFLIQNTFRIIVTQRTRELALLRAIGATRAQVIRMVLTEAALVSLTASALGVLAGVGLAVGIRLIFEAFGGNLPAGDLVLAPRTIVVGITAGMVVTIVSALVPALAASRIPPVAAMREAVALPPPRSLRRRAVIGTAITSTGLALLGVGLLVRLPTEAVSEVALVGAGAGILFIGVAVLTPLFARPLGRTLGAPVAATGMVGRLARENAVRSPRRTSATSSSIMIGTALAGLALIMGASLSATTDALIADRFRSDLIIQPSGFGATQLSPELATELAALPEVERVASLRQGLAEANDQQVFLGAADMAALTALFRFELEGGDLSDVAGSRVALSTELADELGVALDDSVELAFARSGVQPFTVTALYVPAGPGPDGYIGLDAWDDNFIERFDSAVFVDLAGDVAFADGRAAVTTAADSYPGAEVLDQNQFAEEAKTQIRGFVSFVFAMLGLTLLIGFFGILNTLLLSVIERTREIGLLRAVGTTRNQLRMMVTWEAVIVAVFGALVGITLGIFFGWAIVASLGRDSELVLSIPVGWLAVALGVAAVAGVVAAVYPAWRASRLNVLAAIAYE